MQINSYSLQNYGGKSKPINLGKLEKSEAKYISLMIFWYTTFIPIHTQVKVS